jgi:hypothetical protein
MTPESYDERIRKRKAAPIHTYWRSIEVSAMLTKTKARTSPAYQTWMRVEISRKTFLVCKVESI